ncbi:MAG: 4-hydroxythreonine-4-phosphate dehydrogenase PdxA [Bacteroidales bacterium]|nr:4-hydroxythreonine-4-phosphate dehydrogenase PdxA [Bacteroidales bacterium]
MDRANVQVGITHGDINGIGYEIIMKTFTDQRMFDFCTPVLYGSSKVASYHRKTLNATNFNFNPIKRIDQANPERANIINVYDEEARIDLGKCTDIGGKLSLISLQAAISDLKQDRFDALVTAPINKQNIQSEDFHFPGHTEYLAQEFDTSDVLMIMVSDQMRIGVVTGHTPLSDVPGMITQELIMQKLESMNYSLKRDFGISKPRIAVMGLNPHASDDGLLGKEEQDVIIPAINQAFDKGILAFGPYPADGFFGTLQFRKYDGILAMYHDQGLVPFKTLSFDNGVNFTAGLPIVRTSPGHGTGYDIAGKNEASPASFREAVLLATEIFKNRIEWDQMHQNPLKNNIMEKKYNASEDNSAEDLSPENE